MTCQKPYRPFLDENDYWDSDENNYDLETALVEGAKAVLAHQKGELDLPDARDFLNSL